MALTLPTNRTIYTNCEALLNSTGILQPENLYCIREAKNILAKKRLIKNHLILKLKKKIIYPANTTHCHKVCRKHLTTNAVTMPTTSLMSTCYPYQQDYSYPIAANDWNPMHSPLFTVQPASVIVPTPSPVFAAHVCPFAGTVIQPVITPIVPQTFLQEDMVNISNYINDYNFSTDHIDDETGVINEQTYYMQEDIVAQLKNTVVNNETKIKDFGNREDQTDLLELFLTLPRELFPTARSLMLDPNPIIDEFCKMPNLHHHTPWLLDLEFGIPRSPITRPIPIYNVKFNSIHCKNAPDAIHPGFESCDPDFKKVLLFYYDCIVSAWYRGYIIMNYDRSVENFQSWLLLPMQVLGMCWP